MAIATMSVWRGSFVNADSGHGLNASASGAAWRPLGSSVAMRSMPKRKASEELQEISKEEILKEKNRIKQRNLRVRRANQLQSLENNVVTLNESIESLRDTLSASQEREVSLRAWVEALESTLVGSNLSHIASQLRARFSPGDASLPSKAQPAVHRPQQPINVINRPQIIPLPLLNQSFTNWQPPDYPTPRSFQSISSNSIDSSGSSGTNSPQLRESTPDTPSGMSMTDMFQSWPRDTLQLAAGDNGLPTLAFTSHQWGAASEPAQMPFMGYSEPISATPSFWAAAPVIAVPLTHPSVQSARNLLQQIYESTPAPLPALPSLTKPQIQHLLLLALSNLSSSSEQEYYFQLQLANLSPADAAVVVAHAQSPAADPRIVHFPSALLRLRMIQAGPGFDITSFIASMFQEAVIFGPTADSHAWELPQTFWATWKEIFPGASIYCQTLVDWRRRDGHHGATIQDVLMGLEGARSRRTDSVGYPSNWRFARLQTSQEDSPHHSPGSTMSC